jgi:hypothetical protein
VSEGVSTALPKLLPFIGCGGKQRNALRGMNLVLADVDPCISCAFATCWVHAPMEELPIHRDVGLLGYIVRVKTTASITEVQSASMG